MHKLTFSLLLFLFCNVSFTQSFVERFNGDITFLSAFGTKEDQSFWLTHNRYGMLDNASSNALSLLSGSISMRKDRLFDIGGGVSTLARASQSSAIYLHQAYIEAKLGFINFEAGRRETSYGIPLGELSSGNIGIGKNTMPVPRVTLIMHDFFPVPYTLGWVEFKGHFSHGWLNDKRYVQNPYLHDKSFYLQTGGETGLKFYLGIFHSAIWGGFSPVYGQLPSSLADFMRVIVAKEGPSGSPANEVNALGFHSGTYDFGIKAIFKQTEMHLYYQHIFTDGSGMRFRNKLDGLWGINLKKPFPIRWIDEIVYELLNTKNQSGMGVSDKGYDDISPYCELPNCGFKYGGRDSYYNNGIYASGLSYHGMSLGSPFFLTKDILSRFHPNAQTFDSFFFISTRNVVHHLGLKGKISQNLSYSLLTSYAQYFGSYQGLNLGETWGFFNPDKNPEDYFFNPAIKQWYFMIETNFRSRNFSGLSYSLTLALDEGELISNKGVMLQLKYDFPNK